MLKRGILAVVGLSVAAGGPAAYYNIPDLWGKIRNLGAAPVEINMADLPPVPSAAVPSPDAPGPKASPLPDYTPSQDLAEVLRFDVTNTWILRRWPRVSTGMAELPLQGYRVPLVTGTAETDLAGALTYYFNARQEVQRISFRGATGNPRPLIELLIRNYRFTRRLTNDPGLFVYEVAMPGREPASILKIRSAPVVKASEPYQRFEVDLVIERAS